MQQHVQNIMQNTFEDEPLVPFLKTSTSDASHQGFNLCSIEVNIMCLTQMMAGSELTYT